MFNQAFKNVSTTVFCCAMLALPLVANSNSQINAVGNTLKASSQVRLVANTQFAALDISLQNLAEPNLSAANSHQVAELRQAQDRMQVNAGLIFVALLCFVMRANRSRV